MELAALEGREAVFAEAFGASSFAEPDFTSQEFREQIDYLLQKRPKPTRVWTDAMQGTHDRAFVVAGASDIAMLEEFHAAMIEGARTYDIKGFGAEFDRIVEKYGWSYNGGRNWRVRTIFETNIRTSYMAGRLKQMRDPELVKLQPYWMYRHADTRVPKKARELHKGWDGLVLVWDDPWWDVYFPPNDWKCSCGVHGVSRGDLRRMGKAGPDTAPEIIRKPYTHDASGVSVELPEGTGYGWDYMPGDLWERGLVPQSLLDEGGGLQHDGRHVVQIDVPSPLPELLRASQPFSSAAILKVDELRALENPTAEDLVKPFLHSFGASIGQAVLHTDQTGFRMPISDQLFRDRSGAWKIDKGNRGVLTPFFAETIIDPDEIWLGVARKPDPIDPTFEELILDRRYIRADPDTGLIVVFEMGRLWWEPITAHNTTKQGRQNPNLQLLDRRRGGKLLWKRK